MMESSEPRNEFLQALKKKSEIRKNILSKIVCAEPNDVLDKFLSKDDLETQQYFKDKIESNKKIKLENDLDKDDSGTTFKAPIKILTEWKEESANDEDLKPKNDYCQHFVNIGQRPQNFIRDAGLSDRFEEYPKLRELIKLKDELIYKTNTAPMYLQTNFENFSLSDLEMEFDVILIEPPLKEYQLTNGVHFKKYMNWDEIKALNIENISAQRSFIFLWCGSGEGLDKGRECLKKWGFRRCEDICWIKTNKKKLGHNCNLEPKAILQRTKEHCLMGIKGTVRRSVDNDFIHANVDIDLIITEEPEFGDPDKPDEIFNIIEHFCLGRRRLYLFGRDSTARPGWLTVGPELSCSNYDKEIYKSWFNPPNSLVTGCTERIEMLRPKSPPLKTKSLPQQQNQQQQQQQPIFFSTNIVN